MEWRITDAIIPAVVATAGAILIGVWVSYGSSTEFDLRRPGMDAGAASDVDTVRIAPVPGTPRAGEGKAADLKAIWPWFRGPDYDGVCRQKTPLARSWPETGPPALWTVTLGEGYAGTVIGDGCAFVLDYDEEAKADTMRCLSLDDGREVWSDSYPIEVTRSHGMSRTVSALVGDCVISIGPRCHVACWDRQTGECRWLIDMVLEYGATVPRWYTGQCPLVDGDRLILAPAGDVLMAAIDWKTGRPIDAETGEPQTEDSDRPALVTPNPNGWGMTHVSVVPMEFMDQRMYVYCATGAIVGVSADDFSVLWHSTEWTEKYATAPSPVVLPGGQVFVSSGYDSKLGSMIFQLVPSATGFDANVLARFTSRQFNSEQQTPILYEGHLYGVRKVADGRLVCLDLEGNEVWRGGTDRFGHGPYLIVDGLLLALSGAGELVMAEATPAEYRVLGRCQVLESGFESWGLMAIAEGRLILRDITRMKCLDLRAAK